MNYKEIGILLVEDDGVDVMNVKRSFRKNNITNPLYVASDGIEALEFLRTETVNIKPKIVLLDLNMPRMNGLEFLREIRSDDNLRNLSVIVLTTSNDDRDKIEAYDLNVAGYILKPVEFENFVSAVATLNLYWSLIELPE
ncbi:MAG: response regulator [Gammaproteobacteria bacterium]|nr:MAG: response regulator [Gammaproteobacteria bacterium]